MILKYKKKGSKNIKGVLEAENIVNTVDGLAIMLDLDEFDLVAKGDKEFVEWIEYCKKNKGIFLLKGLHETCAICGRVLNNQTDECFVLENGDVICEDCIDYQIYTEEME